MFFAWKLFKSSCCLDIGWRRIHFYWLPWLGWWWRWQIYWDFFAGYTLPTIMEKIHGGLSLSLTLAHTHMDWTSFLLLSFNILQKQIHQIEGFYSVVPQTEIPVWFNHRSFVSVNSVPIKLPDSLFKDESWKGIAVCYFCSPYKFKRCSSWSGFKSLSWIYLSFGHGWRSKRLSLSL